MREKNISDKHCQGRCDIKQLLIRELRSTCIHGFLRSCILFLSNIYIRTEGIYQIRVTLDSILLILLIQKKKNKKQVRKNKLRIS